VLEDAGLVQSKKAGLWVNYSLSDGGSPYAATLLGNLRHWLGDDSDIRGLSEALPSIQREIIIRKKP
jgi:ArsR family transcriptional regulator, arsenate/arsenite/antimonite-responsive transcriptional repressor